MKKLLVLITLTLITMSTAFAKEGLVSQTATVVSNAVDSGKQAVKNDIAIVDTSSNFKMIYNDVKTGVLGLASALKVGAEHVYVVLVKQQVVYAVSNLLLIVLLLSLSAILFNVSRKTYKAHLIMCGWSGEGKVEYHISVEDSAKGVASVILAVGCGLTLILAVIIFCHSYDSIVMGFINPEYGAMKDIINFVKK